MVILNLKINNKRIELNLKLDSLKREIDILEKENKEFKAQTSQVLGEEYLEKEARERLNLKKPGEKVVTVVPQNKEAEKSQEAAAPKSFWQNILEKLGF